MDRSKKLLTYAALFIIALMAFFLNFLKFHDIGFGNTYYAAGVKSMLTSLHNFFFVSYDPGGFVSIDKPPLALWLQCAFAWVFGFNSWAILLPQALASTASVFIIFHLVRKPFGQIAGLSAAFVLATTPILVAVSRTNELDPVLAMVMLLAALVLARAVERGSLAWLSAAMMIAGLGFNTKMAEALMAVPAFYISYFFSSPLRAGKKLIHLGIATIVLVIFSLSWTTSVDLVPPGQRPYVGSSQENSELNLEIGYNGINRMLPGNRGRRNFDEYRPVTQERGNEGGSPGVFRLFNLQMAGQLSWLLPLAIAGILAFTTLRSRSPLLYSFRDPKAGSVLFWFAWALPMMIYFSITGFFHRYYLIMLAPGIAAICGIAVIELWESLGEKNWRKWLLPTALLINALLQTIYILHYPDYFTWLIPLIMLPVLISAAGIIILKYSKSNDNKILPAVFAAIGFFTLEIAPITWSLTPMLIGDQASMPFAGPELKNRRSYAWVSDNPQAPFNPNFNVEKLVNFLMKEKKGEKFIIGVPNAASASPIILKTGLPVMAMGGFSGRDNILTPEELGRMVTQGQIRFFLISTNTNRVRNMGSFQGGGRLRELDSWIIKNGIPVKPALWMEANSGAASQHEHMILMDCKPKIP